VVILDVTNSFDISFIDKFVDLLNFILSELNVCGFDRFLYSFGTSLQKASEMVSYVERMQRSHTEIERETHGSRKRNDDIALVEYPSNGELRGSDVLLLCDSLKLLNEFEVVRHVFVGESVPVLSHVTFREVFVALDLTSEKTSSERRVTDDSLSRQDKSEIAL
jgi:hypothetical protein